MKHRRVHLFGVTGALLIGIASGAGAQESDCEKAAATAVGDAQGKLPCPRPTPATTTRPFFYGYTVYEENDSVVKDGGDQRYTQGLRVELNVHRESIPAFATKFSGGLAKFLLKAADPTPGFAIVIGQNQYTPRIITTAEPERNDRSFSDFNYVGLLSTSTSKNESVRHRFEIDAGILGSPALAKGAQGGLHTLKMRRVPKGWDTTQPKGNIGFTALYRWEGRWAPRCSLGTQPDEEEDDDISAAADAALEATSGGKATDVNCTFDFTAGYGGELGNVRRGVGLHGAVRLGWRLMGFPATTIGQTAGRKRRTHPLEAGVIIGFEPRYIFHTNLVHGTPGTTGFSAERSVQDFRYGFYARYESFRFSYQRVRRSPEYSIGGIKSASQDFATIAASYEPPEKRRRSCSDECERPWLFRHWQLELGMGTAFDGPRVSVGGTRPVAAQIAGRKGLVRRGDLTLTLGLLDMAAATVELGQTPGEPMNRVDLFLRQRSVTLGLNWAIGGGKLGQIGIRGGTGLWGNDARIETVLHRGIRDGEEPVDQDFKSQKGGFVLAGQYFLPLESHLSFGLDIARHSPQIDSNLRPQVPDPAFWKALFLVQVRP